VAPVAGSDEHVRNPPAAAVLARVAAAGPDGGGGFVDLGGIAVGSDRAADRAAGGGGDHIGDGAESAPWPRIRHFVPAVPAVLQFRPKRAACAGHGGSGIADVPGGVPLAGGG